MIDFVKLDSLFKHFTQKPKIYIYIYMKNVATEKTKFITHVISLLEMKIILSISYIYMRKLLWFK